MSPSQRAALLRERMAKLYPQSVKKWTPSGKPRRKPEEPKKPRRIDFSLVGWVQREPDVKWVQKPEKLPAKPVVATKRVERGPKPLTRISELLQPGSPHLAMRRR